MAEPMANVPSEQPTWKDAHDALSAYVTTLVCSMSAGARDLAFAHYTAIRDALTDAESGRTWTEEEHDAECGNGGCPGYEFHRVRRGDSGSTSENDR